MAAHRSSSSPANAIMLTSRLSALKQHRRWGAPSAVLVPSRCSTRPSGTSMRTVLPSSRQRYSSGGSDATEVGSAELRLGLLPGKSCLKVEPSSDETRVTEQQHNGTRQLTKVAWP